MSRARASRWTGAVAATLSALTVVLLVVLDLGHVSPGELSPVHAQLPELAGGSCAACHGEGERSLAEACGDCHAGILEQIAGAKGLHGTIAPDDSSRCGACHPEHHGDALPLAGDVAFGRLGFEGRDQYDHAGLGLELAGRHALLDCGSCHPEADAAILTPGVPRFLGCANECASCHDDPHEGELPHCEACHGQERPFAEAPGFAHVDAFPLEGAHDERACAACHPVGTLALALLDPDGSAPTRVRACEDCHPSPHDPAHVEAARASCETCHPTAHGGFGAGATMSPAQHGAFGFELADPHAALACADCHASAGSFAERHPGRSAQACEACHGDPHAGSFDAGPFGESRCVDCHASTHFAPSTFELSMHARTGLPLAGAHASLDCADCHEDGGAADAPSFAGLDASCATCHADPHQPAFAEACATCHVDSGFELASHGFDHAARTGFPLAGAHAAAACSSCHVRNTSLGARVPVADHFGGPATSCATCHADAHRGRWEDDATDCGTCHDSASFASAALRFDHGTWTGFELGRPHRPLDCATCHPRSPEPDALGRRSAFVADVFGTPVDACSTCHASPHAGTLADAENCARCHDAETFALARSAFEHGLETGFALDGRHAELACSACHTPSEGLRAVGRVHGAARGAACIDCHSDPHAGQFATSAKSACVDCHASTTSFAALAFDHDVDTRFALDATHATLACSSCHPSVSLGGGLEVVRYRPLGTECASCHVTGGGQ